MCMAHRIIVESRRQAHKSGKCMATLARTNRPKPIPRQCFIGSDSEKFGLAYETLSAGMKRLLDRLAAVNSSARADVTRTREDRIRSDPASQTRQELVAEHPVVRTHPETGRQGLYVNIAHTVRFAGMTEAESAP